VLDAAAIMQLQQHISQHQQQAMLCLQQCCPVILHTVVAEHPQRYVLFETSFWTQQHVLMLVAPLYCALQLAFFLLGLCYGCVTFKLAGQIHLEAFYSMPRGKCRRLVKWMAVVSRLLYGTIARQCCTGRKCVVQAAQGWHDE
jgi:hypothetical protein